MRGQGPRPPIAPSPSGNTLQTHAGLALARPRPILYGMGNNNLFADR